MRNFLAAAALVLLGLGESFGQEKLKGDIKIDGSSTVFKITEAMATQFKKSHPDVNITVGISGTGGGFKKFYAGETDINDASRAIKKSEMEQCKNNGIDFLQIQVAWDGMAVIINKENKWAGKLTVEQLKKIWHPDTKDFKNARKWSDLDASWPDEEITLYGPGTDSGTFDYFTEVINGKEKLCRTDFTSTEDDNIIINGVIRNKYALGYMGLAYYEAQKDKLNVVHVKAKGGTDFVEPNVQTVLSKKYAPLGRPLFIYIKKSSLERPEVGAFAEFYLRRSDLVEKVQYVPMKALQQRREQKKLEKALH